MYEVYGGSIIFGFLLTSSLARFHKNFPFFLQIDCCETNCWQICKLLTHSNFDKFFRSWFTNMKCDIRDYRGYAWWRVFPSDSKIFASMTSEVILPGVLLDRHTTDIQTRHFRAIAKHIWKWVNYEEILWMQLFKRDRAINGNVKHLLKIAQNRLCVDF